jgi:hypothetical protein
MLVRGRAAALRLGPAEPNPRLLQGAPDRLIRAPQTRVLGQVIDQT